MLVMELLNIQDVPSWYPGLLLRTVSLPVNEVLEAPPLAAGTQAVNSEGRATINHPGRWMWLGSRHQWALPVRFYLWHMEDGMDTHGPR